MRPTNTRECIVEILRSKGKCRVAYTSPCMGCPLEITVYSCSLLTNMFTSQDKYNHMVKYAHLYVTQEELFEALL